MGFLSLVNHFGTFLLFVATILLVVASISAPTVSSISFLTVDLGNQAGEITFGTFGWCVNGAASGDGCSSTSIGYDPASVINNVEGTDFSDIRGGSAKGLTNVMVLHPVAAGISFIGFLMSLGTSFFGSLLSSLVAGTAFFITVIVLICDWVWMSLVRRKVNDEGDSASARYDAALWLVLAAAICTLVASVVLFFSCCAGRRNRRRAERQKIDHHSPPATTTRRRWWSRH